MNKIIIGALIAIVLLTGTFFTGLYFGKTYFPKEIKIQGKTVEKTVYKYKYLKSENKPVFDQDNFNRLLYCYDSPLLFEDTVEGNTLYVKVYDECKSTEASYKIGTKGNYQIYLTVGVIGILAGTGLTYYLTKK